MKHQPELCQLVTLGLAGRAGLRRGLMGPHPQAHPKIGPPLYQVNEVIKVTDMISQKIVKV